MRRRGEQQWAPPPSQPTTLCTHTHTHTSALSLTLTHTLSLLALVELVLARGSWRALASTVTMAACLACPNNSSAVCNQIIISCSRLGWAPATVTD